MGKDHDLWSEKIKDHLNDLDLLQNLDPFFGWGSDLSSYQDPSNDLDLCHDFLRRSDQRSKIILKIYLLLEYLIQYPLSIIMIFPSICTSSILLKFSLICQLRWTRTVAGCNIDNGTVIQSTSLEEGPIGWQTNCLKKNCCWSIVQNFGSDVVMYEQKSPLFNSCIHKFNAVCLRKAQIVFLH